MKKLLTIILAICVLGSATAQGRGNGRGQGMGRGNAYGKEKPTPEQQAKKQTERLTTRIGLTPDQADKVYNLKLARIQAVRAAKSANPVNGQAIKDANLKYKEDMKQVLTPEQIAKLKEMMKEHREKKERREGGRDREKKEDKKANDDKNKPAPSGGGGDDDIDEPEFD